MGVVLEQTVTGILKSTEQPNPRRVLLGIDAMDAGELVAGDIVRICNSESPQTSSFGVAWPSILNGPGEVQLTETAMLNSLSKRGDRIQIERVSTDIPCVQRVSVGPAAASFSLREVSVAYIKETLVNLGCVWTGQLVDILWEGVLRRLQVQHIWANDTDAAELATGHCALMVSSAAVHVATSDAHAADEYSSTGPVDYDSIGGLEKEIGEVRQLVEAALYEPQMFLEYGLNPPRGVLLYGPPGTGKTLIARAVAHASKARIYIINGAEIMSRYYGESESRIRDIFDQARHHSHGPSIVFIDEIDALCPKRSDGESEANKRVVATLLTLLDGARDGQVGDGVVVLAATNRPNAIDPALRRPGRLDREIEIPIPNAAGRLHILEKKLASMPNSLTRQQIETVSASLHGYVGADIDSLLREAAIAAINREAKLATPALPSVTHGDVELAMKVVRPSTMREITLEIPNVLWSDIGGQHETKQLLRESVEWPLKHAAAFERMGIRPPKGVLLYGPPGCSKTLTAKALATEAGLNFIAVRGPELLSKWVGESEKAVREVFRKARAAAPSIVFFDEIDALAVRRGAAGDGTSVADRVLSQLLTELDGIEPLVSVTVVAATNRPDVIDPGILRPDRIDRQIYIGPPDCAAREEILRLQFRKITVASDVDVVDLAQRTSGFSGAEMVSLCQEAGIEAMAQNPNAEYVEMRHFDACLLKLKPRITHDILEFYNNWRHSH
ncbi:AAA+-type ATPase [Coemansia sp. RSA 1085]|nr:AAA+-type ATPase [Coemansia sp. RSA 1085]